MPFRIVRFICSLMAELIFQLVFPGSLPRYFDGQVNSWWYSETKGLGNGAQIKLVNVEDIALVVGGVCL